MAPAAVVTPSEAPDPEVVHEAWLRECRVDELLSRLPLPPDSLPLVAAILQRLETRSRPPNVVLQGHAAGLSAPQWGQAGGVVQRQIGLLMMTVANMTSNVDPHLLAEIQMETGAAATALSLTAWRSQAETDQLTGLRNELGLDTDLEGFVAQGGAIRIAFIDLDGLKRVNTERGHAAGSQLIRSFGEKLKRVVHPVGGQAYRPHGDEFIVTLALDEGRVDDIIQAFLDTQEFAFSFGVAEWPKDDPDVRTVRRIADQAMYRMKAERHALSNGAQGRATDTEETGTASSKGPASETAKSQSTDC